MFVSELWIEDAETSYPFWILFVMLIRGSLYSATDFKLREVTVVSLPKSILIYSPVSVVDASWLASTAIPISFTLVTAKLYIFTWPIVPL